MSASVRRRSLSLKQFTVFFAVQSVRRRPNRRHLEHTVMHSLSVRRRSLSPKQFQPFAVHSVRRRPSHHRFECTALHSLSVRHHGGMPASSINVTHTLIPSPFHSERVYALRHLSPPVQLQQFVSTMLGVASPVPSPYGGRYEEEA
jgi:hypothetical protein